MHIFQLSMQQHIFSRVQAGKSRAMISPEQHRWQESKCSFALVGVHTEPEVPPSLIPDEETDHFSQICLKKGSYIKSDA